jgi:hypothetical protein
MALLHAPGPDMRDPADITGRESPPPRDGGPAFPEKRATGMFFAGPNGIPQPVLETVSGMSLRDWFAGQCLANYIGADREPPLTFGEIAADCYEAADAMLAARCKSGGE